MESLGTEARGGYGADAGLEQGEAGLSKAGGLEQGRRA